MDFRENIGSRNQNDSARPKSSIPWKMVIVGKQPSDVKRGESAEMVEPAGLWSLKLPFVKSPRGYETESKGSQNGDAPSEAPVALSRDSSNGLPGYNSQASVRHMDPPVSHFASVDRLVGWWLRHATLVGALCFALGA
ncbi:MAG: hypothetical protein SGPRY_005799, partial [Prymnesium sp.]